MIALPWRDDFVRRSMGLQDMGTELRTQGMMIAETSARADEVNEKLAMCVICTGVTLLCRTR